MPTASSTEEDDRISALEEFIFIGWPTDGITTFYFAWIGFSEPISHKVATREVFVLTEAVGSLVGNKTKNIFLICSYERGKQEGC